LKFKSLVDYNGISNYYQIGENTIELEIMLKLLVSTMNKHLRKLSSNSFTCVRIYSNIIGFVFTCRFRNLDEKIDTFLMVDLEKIIQEIPDNEFNVMKQDLVTYLEDGAIREKQINRDNFSDRPDIKVKYLKYLDKFDLLEFYRTRIQTKDLPCLSYQTVGNLKKDSSTDCDEKLELEIVRDDAKDDHAVHKIADIAMFKESLEFYPVPILTNQKAKNLGINWRYFARIILFFVVVFITVLLVFQMDVKESFLLALLIVSTVKIIHDNY
jgi:hypothetical protein